MRWERLARPKKQGGLGFRMLHAFNLALLEKQWWRLTTNDNDLASKVFKACYYKNTSLVSAKLDFRPSFTWRSILRARDTFIDTCIWRVGNGEKISV